MLSLYFQQNFSQRREFVTVIDASRTKVGRNNLINRFNVVNGKINYNWLNLSIYTFKVKCKYTFLA